MNRERALKILLVLVGLLFSAGIYPLTLSLWKMKQSDYGDDMMLSLYFALGIFLLMAVRNPSANRSLIAFAAWSSFGFDHCKENLRSVGVAPLTVFDKLSCAGLTLRFSSQSFKSRDPSHSRCQI